MSFPPEHKNAPQNTSTRPHKVVSLNSKLPREVQRERSFSQQITLPPRRLTIGLLLTLTAFATLLALSSMLVISLPNGLLWLTTGKLHYNFYSLQLPIAIMIACVFGPRYGTVVCTGVLMATLLGLPLFANGGGPFYWTFPGFGYSVGLCLVALLISKELKKGFKGNGCFRGRSFYILFSGAIAVIIAHGCGVLGLAIQALLSVRTLDETLRYLEQLSFSALPTDLILAMAAACLTRWIRAALFVLIY